MGSDERAEWAEQMPDLGPDTQILDGEASRALLAELLSDDGMGGIERLAELAEAGQLASVDGIALYGQDAARFGRSLLLEATGADTIEEAVRIALGPAAAPGEEGSAV